MWWGTPGARMRMRKRNRLDIHAYKGHNEALSVCNKITNMPFLKCNTIRSESNHIKHLPNLTN